MPMWGYGGYGPGWLGMLVMALNTLLGLALVIVVVWALVRWLTPRAARPQTQVLSQEPRPTALEVLEQRYARGEIDTPTVERMRGHLRAAPRVFDREEVKP